MVGIHSRRGGPPPERSLILSGGPDSCTGGGGSDTERGGAPTPSLQRGVTSQLSSEPGRHVEVNDRVDDEVS